MTKLEKFEALKANHNFTGDELEFINHEIELLKNRNATKKKTKTQILNDSLKDEIFNFLGKGGKYTVTELIKENAVLIGLTNQKVSNLTTQLVKEGLIQRVEIGRKAYFTREQL